VNGESALAEMVEGATDALFDDLFGSNPDAKNLSVNEAAFTTLLQLIDESANKVGIQHIRFVHDETASFQDTLTAVHERLRAKSPGSTRVIYGPHGNKLWPLLSIQDLSFTVSHGEPLVQAADVAAATMSWVCAMNRPDEFAEEQEIKYVAESLTALWTSTEPRLVHPLVADDDIRAIGRTLAVLRGL